MNQGDLSTNELMNDLKKLHETNKNISKRNCKLERQNKKLKVEINQLKKCL